MTKTTDMKFSSFGKLNPLDLGKGLVLGFITSILTEVEDILSASRLPTKQEAIKIATISVTAGLAYLIKNLLTGVPKEVIIDTKKTTVIEKDTDRVIIAPKV